MSTIAHALKLERVPKAPNLQAWDAADQYLLQHLEENQILRPGLKILTINEPFGALSVALAEYRPVMMSDSYLSCLALSNNLALNNYPVDQVSFRDCLSMPTEKFDLILIKIPKSLALLEHQLYKLQAVIDTKSIIIAAAMSRHIHKSTLALFEKILGSTKTTLAWKKSRLILVQQNSESKQGQSPYPEEFVLHLGQDFIISNHASVFSRERLDAGTRLLLENMPVSEQYRQIIDLGCGNGLLGLVAALVNLAAELSFVDESYMAVDSAKINFKRAFGDNRKAEFKVSNCLEGFEADSADLVLINPPFHQQHHVGDAVAWQMFTDARRVLRKGGEVVVVGNRHLAYHAKLKKIYGQCQQLASNRKFVVLRAVKK